MLLRKILFSRGWITQCIALPRYVWYHTVNVSWSKVCWLFCLIIELALRCYVRGRPKALIIAVKQSIQFCWLNLTKDAQTEPKNVLRVKVLWLLIRRRKSHGLYMWMNEWQQFCPSSPITCRILITSLFTKQPWQETAKGPFCLQVKLPPVYLTRTWKLYTVLFIAEC